jgi:hypothetical protein
MTIKCMYQHFTFEGSQNIPKSGFWYEIMYLAPSGNPASKHTSVVAPSFHWTGNNAKIFYRRSCLPDSINWHLFIEKRNRDKPVSIIVPLKHRLWTPIVTIPNYHQGCQVFLRINIKNGKNIPNDHKIHKMAKNIPNDPSIGQMAIKCTNNFLQNLPKSVFLVWKYAIWQPW